MAKQELHNVDAPLTEAEAEAFLGLTSEPQAAEIALPTDIVPAKLWLYLESSGKMYRRANDAIARLKPTLGRILDLLRYHPHLYEAYGYTTWTDFMSRGMWDKFRICRAEAFGCVQVAKALGFLPAATLEQIGTSKLKVVARALRDALPDGSSIEMIERKRNEWVQAGLTLTTPQLHEKMANAGLIEAGQLDYYNLVIRVNTATKDEWQRVIAIPEIRQYCETEEPGGILAVMIAECEGHFIAKMKDAIRG